MQKKVSILIPSRFDNLDVLKLNLLTIRKYTKCGYKIIIGDAGISPDVIEYLNKEENLSIIKCKNPLWPKVDLVEAVDTPYFIFLHDDSQILKENWIINRLHFMEKNERIGIVGPMSFNHLWWWKIKRFFPLAPHKRRFFPFGMLLRTQTQKELKLFWGGFEMMDIGTIAYLQFTRQKKWKFKNYDFKKDIKHWGEMTWVLKKRDKMTPLIKNLRNKRLAKIDQIKKIIENSAY